MHRAPFLPIPIALGHHLAPTHDDQRVRAALLGAQHQVVQRRPLQPGRLGGDPGKEPRFDEPLVDQDGGRLGLRQGGGVAAAY